MPARGFTVIELIVTTGIIVLILGVVLAGYPRFRTHSSLAALARSVGLLVREAQVYGLAVKQFPTGSKDFPPYGVHIGMQRPREIILFGDLDSGARAGVYDIGDGCATPDTECIRRFTLTGPEYIDKICVNPGGGSGIPNPELGELCSSDENGIPEVNITFRRPDPEAIIVTSDSSKTYNGASIYLRSNSIPGEHRQVRVWVTGQISIQ